MEAKMRLRLAVMSALLASFGVHARPQVLVATSTKTTTTESTMLENAPPEAPIPKATISKLHVRSDIQFRYSRTQVKSYIKNPSNRGQRVEFEILLPEKAFISNFTIETKDEVHVSEVKEKQEARNAFESAASSGQSAGIVDAREGNVFSVQTNVPGSEKLTFTLTYEQLLERRLSKYEQSIHVDPKQLVDDLKIDVYINESLPIINVNVPEIKKSSNEIVELLEPNSIAVVEGADTSQVHVQYHPSRDEQKKVNADKGITGHFIVQYDVNRKQQVNQVQVLDGYFVHFFAPEDLPTIPKHVVFVLDVSGSMSGEKIQQLKDSMVTILDDLDKDDFFSLLTFSNQVEPWRSGGSERGEEKLFYEGTEELRNEALNYVLQLTASGGTNIYDALSEAVRIVDETVQSEKLGSEVTSVVVFLTDGQPSSGQVTSAEGIREHVRTVNKDVKVPIYGLAFGANADFEFVKSLSLENLAYARRIYEGSDAAIQLEDFYKEICSPLLTDVTFKYVGGSFANQTGNVRSGATFHKGSEFVTVGKINPYPAADETPEIVINAISAAGPYQDSLLPCPKPWPHSLRQELPQRPTFLPGPCFPLPPVLPPKPQTPKSRSENFIQRLWAKMTIDQLLDDDKNKAEDKSEEMERREKALKLSLEYNFVTDLTSLVVVKPDEKDAKDKSVATLTPVGTATTNGPFAYQQYASNFAVYSANAFPSPKRRTSPHGLRVASTSIHGLRAAPSFNRVLTGNVYSTTPPSLSHTSSQRRRYGPLNTTPFASPGNYQDYSDEISSSDSRPTTTCSSVDTCQLRLHTKTYLRGRRVAVNDTVEEFTDPIGSSVTSLEAVGPCTWKLFSEKMFGGDSEEFGENKYNSADLLRKIFRNVKSIEKTYRC